MIIGIDPGGSGGAVAIGALSGDVESVLSFKNTTPHDVRAWIVACAHPPHTFPRVIAFLERVGSMPAQGLASTFKFGRSFGMLEGILVGLNIPYHLVRPQRWQKHFGLIVPKSKGLTKVEKKNRHKAEAQRRWPARSWIHATADAALIAEYGRTQCTT